MAEEHVDHDTADLIKGRALRLFSFVRELVQLKSKTIRSLDNYEQTIWVSEIPREKECQCAAWMAASSDGGDDIWLSVRKPELIPAPGIPSVIVDWVDPHELAKSDGEPRLSDRIVVEPNGDMLDEDDDAASHTAAHEAETGPVFEELADHPEVAEAWQAYLEGWKAWAEVDQRKRRVQRIYTSLFTMQQQQQELGESYEVVLGIGQLRWALESGQEVNRHLVVAQTEIDFDPVKGDIRVRASSDGARPRLEQDMLEPSERPDGVRRQAIETQLANVEDDVWQDDCVVDALKSWINSVAQGKGQYSEVLDPAKSADCVPKVRWAPALILRRRSERGFLEVYTRILQELENNGQIPDGLTPLVDDSGQDRRPDAWDGRDERQEDGVSSGPEDIFFPLPANDEQREIVNRLRRSRGVLVQGPPGTGKSHTIANLVSHLLATGQRVLVTSQTERALRVLREKIPVEIRELAVVLLGHGRDAFEELEGSVHGITGRLNLWDEHAHIRRVKQLDGELEGLRRQAALVDKEIRDVREADTRVHPAVIGDYTGTLQKIAVRVASENPRFSWMKQHFDGGLSPELSIPRKEAMELLELLRMFGKETERGLKRPLPELNALTDPDEFDRMVVEEGEASREANEIAETCDASICELSSIENVEVLTDIAQLIEDLLSRCKKLKSFPHAFAGQAVNEVLAGSSDGWEAMRDESRKRLAIIENYGKDSCFVEVTGYGDLPVRTVGEDAVALARHVKEGGRLTRSWLRYQQPVRQRRYIVEQVRVGGMPVKTAEALDALVAWASVVYQMERLRGLWEGVVEVPDGDPTRQMAFLHGLLSPLDAIKELSDSLDDAQGRTACVPGFNGVLFSSVENLEVLRRNLRGEISRRSAVSLTQRLDSMVRRLTAVLAECDRHPLVDDLIDAINRRDGSGYRRAFAGVEETWNLRAKLDRRDELFYELQEVCSPLAEALWASPSDEAWDTRLNEIEDACSWARVDEWLIERTDPVRYEQLVAQQNQLHKQIQKKTTEVAAARAWGSCMTRMTLHEESHLKGWMKAIEKIGAGTGKRAAKFRKVAREYLDECRSAIPAWVMPLHRVVESVTPGEDLFDVVIVDEASQSGMEALFLFYIAKKIVVVGDDKQIAPYYVGIDRDEVNRLQRQYLEGLPLRHSYDLEHSFFAQAELRYRDRVRLREHFRCMPEIIQFSNDLCYQNEPLVPLRQYGADRLEPPVKAVYVDDGFYKGSARNRTNPAEAQAIVDAIERCTKDSRYDGMTMGVVSLLGQYQAREIEARLLGQIGPAEIAERRLVCGDAYAFQGDERDVMFLSLVTAPEGISTLSQKQDTNVRRFNVATSRAKNQMWLFHSVTLDELSPVCLRRRLLDYGLHPRVLQDRVGEVLVSEVERLSKMRRHDSVPPEPFDSWFEVDVFLRIHARGFRVEPQYEVAGHRIDLVVSGMKARVAVECDGEEWHGPEQFEADQARQRKLERCGWQFVRIRGGAFYRDPDESLKPLWDFLDEHGIRPGTEEQSQPESELKRSNDYRQDEVILPQEDIEPVRSVQEDPEEDLLAAANQISTGVPPRSPGEDSAAKPGGTDAQMGETAGNVAEDTLFGTDREKALEYIDPRDGDLRQVRKGLVAIVKEHGPMPCHYTYRLYAQNVGIHRIGRVIRKTFNRAMAAAVRSGELVQVDEYGTRGQANQIVRIKGTPAVNPRAVLGRNLDEIPPSEIAAAMRQTGGCPAPSDDEREWLYRETLQRYGFVRLTKNVRSLLDIAYGIYLQAEQD